MSFGPSNEDRQKLKMLSYQIKATTYLKAETKTKFLKDCILRGETECLILREIVKLHYELIEHYLLEGKEFSDIKKILIK